MNDKCKKNPKCKDYKNLILKEPRGDLHTIINSDEYGPCIFHSQNDEKGTSFYKIINELLSIAIREDIPLDFSHFYFPDGDLGLRERVFGLFNKVACCENAVFKTDIKFSNTFLQSIKFDHSHFHNETTFYNCKFKQGASFQNCHFHQNLECEHIYNYNFSLNFTKAKCYQNSNAQFSDVKEIDGLILDGFICENLALQQCTDINNIHLDKETRISNSFQLHLCNFTGEAIFSYVNLPNRTKITNTTFNTEKTDFIETIFGTVKKKNQKLSTDCKIEFSNVTFIGPISFIASRFNSDVEFSSSKLENIGNDSEVDNTWFKKECDFSNSRFNGKLTFNSCKFSGDLLFNNSRFKQPLTLNNCDHDSGNIVLTYTRFYKNAEINIRKGNYNILHMYKSVIRNKINIEEHATFKISFSIKETLIRDEVRIIANINNGLNLSLSKFKKGLILSYEEKSEESDKKQQSTKFLKSNFVSGDINLHEIVIDEGGIQASKISFPGSFDISLANIKGEVDFSETEFHESLESIGTAYCGKTSFQKAKFPSRTNMNIPTDTIFRYSSFQELIFDDCSFLQEIGKFIDFSNCSFNGKTSFNNIKNLNVDFSYSLFRQNFTLHSMGDSNIILKNNIFGGEITSLSDINFTNGIISDVIFCGNFEYENHDDFKSKEYENVIFIGCADFREKILKDYRFSNCFIAGCSFLRSEIKDTVFSSCYYIVKDAIDRISELQYLLIELNHTEEINKDLILNLRLELLDLAKIKLEENYIKSNKQNKVYFLDEIMFYEKGPKNERHQ